MGIVIFRLVSAALLPVAVTVFFCLAEKKSKFGQLSEPVRQGVIGVCFGIVAVLATEFGIPVDGAVMNVRNAAPLTAGLIFGWPAGLISGLIGGIQRWLSDAGDFTRVACTIGTIVSGIMGASVRKFMMDNKKASWLYGLMVGVTSEVLHMLLVFLSNADEIERAFNVVQIVAVPMILSNGISVMIAILAVSALGSRFEKVNQKTENISQMFQRWLLLCVLMAFIATSLFTYAFQSQIANASTNMILETNIEDIRKEIRDTSDRNLLNLTKEIAAEVPEGAKKGKLIHLALKYDVSEINIVNEEGIISVSSEEELVGFDMSSGAQAAEFLALLDTEEELVQSYQPITRDSDTYRKYAGVATPEGFLQVGYDTVRFYDQIDEQVKYAAQNRHVGKQGSIMICDENGVIVSGRDGYEGQSIDVFDRIINQEILQGECFETAIYNEDSYCMYMEEEGYYIIGVYPKSEAEFTRSASIYMLAFMEVLVFAALFVFVFVLIKRLVVENIRKINASLSQITKGNLDIKVNVRTNEEFAALSDDINSTVTTLKHYIAEAEARIDQELEFAKRIQHSALPSVFPPYPNRDEFDIYATMDTAKEVGGDFYDFYMLGENRIAFLIADVSGKGVPAAMFMMTAKTLIKSLVESSLQVDEVFTQANEKLCEGNDTGMFVTAWMGVLDLKTGVLSYVNAGHNPPVLRRNNGRYEYLKERPNFILAGMDGVRYKKHELVLEPGDEVFLYTDGITEAQDHRKQLFGEDRLLVSLNSCTDYSVEQICRQVKKDVEQFVAQEDQFDDMTMLSIKLNSKPQMSSLEIVPAMDTFAAVSGFLEEELEKMQVPMKVANKLQIALDEVYSNIVRYSGADQAEIQCGLDKGTLTLRLIDNGVPYNPLEAEAPDITLSAEDRNIGGLGIFMVRKMMDHVDYMYKDGHNVLTLTMENVTK